MTAVPTSRAGSLPLVGGMLALDFCNTSSGRGSEGSIEHLRTFGDVLTWAHHAGILDQSTKVSLRAKFEANAALGYTLMTRALALREALHALTVALTQGRQPDQAAIDVVAQAHAACISKGRLTTKDGAFGWTWAVEDAPAESVLGPIAASAMALITAADRARLKRCEGHRCGWLFLDATKSNNRRWCEMEPCGNRAKQSRRRGRLRAES